jgi:hypothetical protein
VVSRIESNGFSVWSGDQVSIDLLIEQEGEDLEAALQVAAQTGILPAARLVGVDTHNSVCVARAIYPVASMFNHSYAPNLYTGPLNCISILHQSSSGPVGESSADPCASLSSISAVAPLSTEIGLGRLLIFTSALDPT